MHIKQTALSDLSLWCSMFCFQI